MGRIRQSWLLGIVMLKNAPQHTQRRHSYVQSEWETLLPTCANACWPYNSVSLMIEKDPL